MATQTKVREFMAATGVEKNYESITLGMCQQMEHAAIAQNDLEGFHAAGATSGIYKGLQSHLVAFMSSHYEECYTDDELDELIVIYNMAVSRKGRELVPVLQQGILNSLGEKMAQLVSEVMA